MIELLLIWRDVLERQERLAQYCRRRAAWLRCQRELQARVRARR